MFLSDNNWRFVAQLRYRQKEQQASENKSTKLFYCERNGTKAEQLPVSDASRLGQGHSGPTNPRIFVDDWWAL